MKIIPRVITTTAFDFWRSGDFRNLVNFDDISQIERDRIFNELEVSILGLFILKFGYLEKQTVRNFLELMQEVGIGQQQLKQWEQLIDARIREYTEHYQIALDQTGKFKELQEKESQIIWARIETITIDCLSHIRKGRILESDPLWTLLREWIMMLDLAFEKIMSDSKFKIQLGTS